jgi:virulence-associated protein VapD
VNKYLIVFILLASCVQKQEVSPLSRIYQAKTLILLPNTEVRTKEGVYISGQNVEIFHSAETVERLEKIISQF